MENNMIEIDLSLPSVIIYILFIMGLLLITRFFFWPLFKNHLIASKIKIINDGFCFKAGGWFDEIHLTFPFVKVKLEPQFINICHSNYNFELKYDQIQSVNLYQGPLTIGVEIRHKSSTISKKIIIWTAYHSQMVNYVQSKIT
jgi:hypothetical protein